MEKGQIRQRIRNERIEEKVLAGVGLKQDEIEDVFGESDDEYEWDGFSDESERMNGEVDLRQRLEFVDEGDPMVNLEVEPTSEVDTWRDSDGNVRPLTDVENEVLGLLRMVRDDGEWKEVPNLRATDRRKVMKEVELVDGLMHNLISDEMDVTDVNRLLYAGGAVVAMRLGLKVGTGKKAEVKPWWQRRIERSIEMWRKHLSQVEEIRKGKEVGKKVRKELEGKYQLTERGAASVSTFLKSKIQAGSTKI